MRLVLSRKGFDTSAGGVPSPILPDRRMVSLPIPDRAGNVRYEELHPRRLPVADMVRDLTKGRHGPRGRLHLDPDLERTTRPRRPGWRPAFGQAGAAAGHLDKQGVGCGDLFLFFGWFRPVEQLDDRWRYIRGVPAMHTLFGWLRVGAVIDPATDVVPWWLEEHAHAVRRELPHSRVYVAARSSDGGVFATYDDSLRLTAPEAQCSLWRLPAAFWPGGRTPLSYHADPARWGAAGDACLLQTVARGQEFVLDCDRYPAARRWAEEFVGRTASQALAAGAGRG